MLFKISDDLFIELVEFEVFINERVVETIKYANSFDPLSVSTMTFEHKYDVRIRDLKNKEIDYTIKTLDNYEDAKEFLRLYVMDKSFRLEWK